MDDHLVASPTGLPLERPGVSLGNTREHTREHNLGSPSAGPLDLRIRSRGFPAMPGSIRAPIISSDIQIDQTVMILSSLAQNQTRTSHGVVPFVLCPGYRSLEFTRGRQGTPTDYPRDPQGTPGGISRETLGDPLGDSLGGSPVWIHPWGPLGHAYW